MVRIKFEVLEKFCDAVMKEKRFSAWQGLEDCVVKGLVKDIGVSNFTVHHLSQLLNQPGLKIKPSVNQVNLFMEF